MTAKPGDLFRLALKDGSFGYARLLEHGRLAFYDCRTEGPSGSFEDVLSARVAFIVSVRASALERWTRVGFRPLEGELAEPVLQFSQKADDYTECRIFDIEGMTDRSATPEECIGLERWAVWEPEGVEQRLLDHFEGRTNPAVEHLKVRTEPGAPERLRQMLAAKKLLRGRASETRSESSSRAGAVRDSQEAGEHSLREVLRGDAARVLLEELQREGVTALRAALARVATADSNVYVDVDDGAQALSAIEIVAISIGEKDTLLAPGLRLWAEHHGADLNKSNDGALARRALERLMGSNSELPGLVGRPHPEIWKHYVDVLLEVLPQAGQA